MSKKKNRNLKLGKDIIVNMLKTITYLFLAMLCVNPVCGVAQRFSLAENQACEKVRFELINNLIVVPIKVNGTELSFVLDSGVSTPILFNLSNKDSLELKNVSEITINGLGDGEPINALSSKGNFFQIGGIRNVSQKLYVVMDSGINFSPSLGVPIHGIVGYDLFRDFIVDINYAAMSIKFYDPKGRLPKLGAKYETLPVEIVNRKAYLNAHVLLHNNDIKVKMLLDTGSSDAVWLFEDERIKLPERHYEDYLGRGLAGDIFGKRTKIDGIRIGDFTLVDAKTAFPDMLTFNTIKDLGNRNGSLGGEILKRFNMVFDYPHGKISLRKNTNFKKPYHYNVSGIDLQHAGLRYVSERIANSNGVVEKTESYGNVQILLAGATRLSLVPEIVVSGIRTGSPAHSAGLKEGDVILAVNGKPIHRYKIQEITEMLNEKEGKRVKVLVERSNNNLLFSFVLKKLFQ